MGQTNQHIVSAFHLSMLAKDHRDDNVNRFTKRLMVLDTMNCQFGPDVYSADDLLKEDDYYGSKADKKIGKIESPAADVIRRLSSSANTVETLSINQHKQLSNYVLSTVFRDKISHGLLQKTHPKVTHDDAMFHMHNEKLLQFFVIESSCNIAITFPTTISLNTFILRKGFMVPAYMTPISPYRVLFGAIMPPDEVDNKVTFLTEKTDFGIRDALLINHIPYSTLPGSCIVSNRNDAIDISNRFIELRDIAINLSLYYVNVDAMFTGFLIAKTGKDVRMLTGTPHINSRDVSMESANLQRIYDKDVWFASTDLTSSYVPPAFRKRKGSSI